MSRRLAAAQMIAAVEAGGRTVSLGSILGPEFAATPKVFFGPDRFHPSAAGYSSLASVLLPSVLAAMGVIPDAELVPEAARGETVLPIAKAAVEATKVPGTEIDGTEVGRQRARCAAAGGPRSGAAAGTPRVDIGARARVQRVDGDRPST